MATCVPFESEKVKDAKREEKQRARAVVLEKAKKEYEKAEWRKEQAKLRGEDEWMLPSIQSRIDKEEKEMEKVKSKKRSKEKKKKRKLKKEKKRKKKHQKGSDSESKSDSDADEIWVEKPKERNKFVEEQLTAVKGPQLQRDSWMEAPIDLIPLTSRQEIRESIQKDKEEKEKQQNLLDQPGQHALELNPYWKEGGTGLPTNEGEKDKPVALMGDGGVSWLRKAYDRCVQKAKEENKTVEEVAADTYGSLKSLKRKLAAAEKANKELSKGERTCRSPEARRKSFRKPDNSDTFGDDYQTSSRKMSFKKPGSSDDESKSRSQARDRKRSRSRSGERHRSRSKDKYRKSSNFMNKRRERSRSCERELLEKKSRLCDRDSRERSKRFRRPGDSDEDVKTKCRPMFRGPSEGDDSRDRSTSFSPRNSGKEDNYTPSWRKKEFMKTKQVEQNSSKISTEKPSMNISSSVSSTSSDSSSSSESDSADESGKRDAVNPSIETAKKQEIKVLSEQEMNLLGAKLVKAELMGNEVMVSKIKAQMEASRKLKEEHKTMPRIVGEKEEEAEDEYVVLSRTGPDGIAQPLPDRQHPKEQGKRRRKKEKVETHDKVGDRQRYFDDDDQFDLNTLVLREKMGTAEDQNSMFARLAGRAVEKTDDDYQLDDMFISRAGKKQSDSRTEEKERCLAMGEHRKMASVMEKCQFCFGNVPKHLIIAIGTKVYLCMPNHCSLTEGHCLVVPMQHVASSTAMDEDVWNEVQLFRKTLTKLFLDLDQDVVFMETSMGLKHSPHMYLECVPMQRETGDLAPIYFKKAIQDSETEWTQNKKVVDLSQKSIRRAVPKGFPFFSVDFGLQGGFAHVIEDEQVFPRYFGKEIIGGMLDVEPRLWRKNQKESFDEQRKKVLQFSEWWKPHDWTQNLHQDG
ncbi:CWF19-like protein 2 [Mizuhopecten yessoensis]|uniref:CWF19-like protein 2 n=1 Tax=Mizuhopecten yessoensis TaxID=6573 RepID=A0A210QTV0_MIZYE|nr:CWF19-like protein 2 [Mizuhopecten yessoensis]OWF52178.1 CWF19-like protein 2 [Mizuhopecten yessoensis]